MFYNSASVHRSRIRKRTNAPVWSESFEVFVCDYTRDKFKFFVQNQRDVVRHTLLGELELSVKEMVGLSSPSSTSKCEWWSLRNAESGKIRLTFSFKEMRLDHKVEQVGCSKFVPSIGVARVCVVEASDLKNLEALRHSDPYVKLFYGGHERAKTHVIDNNLNPIWNETHYILIQNSAQKGILAKGVGDAVGTIGFELYDYNNLQSDKFMGHHKFELKNWSASEASVQLSTDESELISPAIASIKQITAPSTDKSELISSAIASGNPSTEVNKLNILLVDEWVPLVSKDASTTRKNAAKLGQLHYQIEYLSIIEPEAAISEVKRLDHLTQPASNVSHSHVKDETKAVSQTNAVSCDARGSAGIFVLAVQLIHFESDVEENNDAFYYLEFIDISNSLYSNESSELFDHSVAVFEQNVTGNGRNATMMRKRPSADFEKLTNSKLSLDFGSLKLLFRTRFFKRSESDDFSQMLEVFCKESKVAKMMVLLKCQSFSETSNARSSRSNSMFYSEDSSLGRVAKVQKDQIIGKQIISFFELQDTIARDEESKSTIKISKLTVDGPPMPPADIPTHCRPFVLQSIFKPSTATANSILSTESASAETEPIVATFDLLFDFKPIFLSEKYLTTERELSEFDAGHLHVNLLKATHLPAVDSSGTSDPFCIFKINNVRLHRSKTVMKNVNPVW